MAGIENKVIILTGAGTGIGRATALLLAQRGAKLVLAGRRLEPLEQLRHEIESLGGNAVCRATDVSVREEMFALVALACDLHGRLDVLISNAAIAPISKIEDLQVGDWEAMVDVNFKGLLHGIAATIPVFLRQGSGHFVNTITSAGQKVSPTMAVYAATKSAVRTLTEGLRIESAGRYRVTGISPGFVATDLPDSMTHPDVRAKIRKAMDSMALQPDAIARAMVYAIEQPDDVDVGDIVVRPAVQD